MCEYQKLAVLNLSIKLVFLISNINCLYISILGFGISIAAPEKACEYVIHSNASLNSVSLSYPTKWGKMAAALFSARGPSVTNSSILKPDVITSGSTSSRRGDGAGHVNPAGRPRRWCSWSSARRASRWPLTCRLR
jgi:hypothetical protein